MLMQQKVSQLLLQLVLLRSELCVMEKKLVGSWASHFHYSRLAI